ncbi:MAG: DUF2842 domain-containing protein [Pseudomonadota bacterium]
MALTHKAKKRWALLILLVGLPVYVVAAVTIVNLLDRPALWVEFCVYVGLGVVWALPLKAIFRGIGQADPNDPGK